MDMENKDRIGAEDVIRAQVNQPFVIALDSIPTAGYVWTINYDSHFLKLIDEKYQCNSHEAVGSAGRQTFFFTPLQAGEVDAVATFKRPWEDGVLEERTFRIQISE
ncbi:MAG: protease inhibitor I42 family protein [Methanothrix sp.]|nr:protease inhibitor I42 family protein [Methanothrix sp.]